MPWPPRQPARDEIDEHEVACYDQVIARVAKTRSNAAKDAGYYGRLLLSPTLASLLSETGRTVRALGDSGKSFSHADREFVDQVLSVELGTNIIQGTHLNDALSTGVRLEAIEALRAREEEGLTDREAVLAEFIRHVIHGQVDQDSWERAEAMLGERAVVDYVIFILFLQLTMRLMSAVAMPSPTDDQVAAMIAEIRSGRRPVDDFRTRIV